MEGFLTLELKYVWGLFWFVQEKKKSSQTDGYNKKNSKVKALLKYTHYYT